MRVLLDSGQGASSPSDLGLGLLQALIALVLVSALAWLALRFAAQRGFGARRGKSLQIEERVALDLKNALVVVRFEGRRLLLAVHQDGPARLIAELAPSVPATERGEPAAARAPSP